MNSIHQLLLIAHIAMGSAAIILLWVPSLTRKGGRLHVQAGRWYVFSMYGVCVTALFTSVIVLADPLAIRQPGQSFTPERAAELAGVYRMFSLFLLMLSALVFASIRHGVNALRARRNPAILRSGLHRATVLLLGAMALPVGALGYQNGQWLLVVFAGISVNAAFGMWRDLRVTAPNSRELVVMHLRGLAGSGIGAYTAFFAFGGSRFLRELLPGQWQIVMWVAPAIVGSLLVANLAKKYGPQTSSGRTAKAAEAQEAA